jgi:hypothetical protein
MSEVGHGEPSSGKPQITGHIRMGIEFILAVLLAFIAFTVNELNDSTSKALTISQASQIAIGRVEAKLDATNQRLDATNQRLDRLERSQDRGSP